MRSAALHRILVRSNALGPATAAFVLLVGATGTVAAQGGGEPGGLTAVLVEVVVSVVLYLVVGGVLVAVAPDTTEAVVDRVRRDPLVSGATGIGATLLFLVVVVLLAITMVGVIVVVPLALVFALVEVAGTALGVLAVGSVLVDATGDAGDWSALLVGAVLVSLLGAIPFLGGIVAVAVHFVGLGSLAIHLTERYDRNGGRQSRRHAARTADSENHSRW